MTNRSVNENAAAIATHFATMVNMTVAAVIEIVENESDSRRRPILNIAKSTTMG